jgi:basic membrane protein A and related proteins
MDPMLKVAKQFPDTVFMHCSGFKQHPNMGNYFGRMYQARYLSGMVAGAMTQKKILGYVAAFPIPEVIRGINAFTLGAQAVSPDIQVRVVWTKTWYDPATEKEAAKSLLDVGADVIAQHQDSPGPQEAAQEAGAYAIGYNSDMTAFAPKAHLVAPVWNWAGSCRAWSAPPNREAFSQNLLRISDVPDSDHQKKGAPRLELLSCFIGSRRPVAGGERNAARPAGDAAA